jgi:hypothetical protein
VAPAKRLVPATSSRPWKTSSDPPIATCDQQSGSGAVENVQRTCSLALGRGSCSRWLPAKSSANTSSTSPAFGSGNGGVSTTVPSAWVSVSAVAWEKKRSVSA